MPHFRIETNVPKGKIPADLPAKIAQTLSKVLAGKPLNYCAVTVVGDVNTSFGGDATKPAAQATLMSIGALGPKENVKISKALAEVVEQSIGVPSDRMYIHFQNAAASDVGYNGTTFGEIFGG
ncbi:macrophage migration inhibitory factor homolog [Cylas formicarius]|uniref:macrophage migration inhibitory factor homolog n=1 Tax=Cylas formicarius TaxID=197179 RepID=UPI0029589750|nr:macrophage migration inhibitory factor homolog [Cylas formicarius]